MAGIYRLRAERLEQQLRESTATSAALECALDAERSANAERVAELQEQLEHEMQEVIKRQEMVCLTKCLRQSAQSALHRSSLL
jgi:hypothetical protein